MTKFGRIFRAILGVLALAAFPNSNAEFVPVSLIEHAYAQVQTNNGNAAPPPCQWNYANVNGVATATYCGNVVGANYQDAVGPARNVTCVIGDSQTIASNTQNSQSYLASGGTAPYTFNETGLPSGISATPATPNITFAPSNALTSSGSFTVNISDSASHSGSVTYSYSVTTQQQLTLTQTAQTGTLSLALSSRTLVMQDRGPAYVIQFYSNGALQSPYNLVYGHSGDTTVTLLSRMTEILNNQAACGQYVIPEIGTNDLGQGLTTAQIEGNIYGTATTGAPGIVNQLLSTTRPVTIGMINPRGLNPATNATAIAQLYAINLWLKSLQGINPNLTIVDNLAYGDPLSYNGSQYSYVDGFFTSGGTAPYTWSATGLPANVTMTTNASNSWGILTSTATVASTQTITVTVTDSASHTGTMQLVLNINPQRPNPISLGENGTTGGTLPITRYLDYSYDQLHCKSAGCYAAWGPLEASLIAGLPTAAGFPTESNLNTFNATYNPHGNLLTNGMMTFQAGTGTLASGSVGTAAGKAADGWILYTKDGGATGNYTATGSAGNDSFGNPSQHIVLSGNAVPGYETIAVLAQNITNFTNFNVNAPLYASCHVEVAAGAAKITPPYVYVNYNYGAESDTIASGAWFPGLWDGDSSPNVAYKGTIPPVTPGLPLSGGGFSGTLSFWVGVTIAGGYNGTIAGTIDISDCALWQ